MVTNLHIREAEKVEIIVKKMDNFIKYLTNISKKVKPFRRKISQRLFEVLVAEYA